MAALGRHRRSRSKREKHLDQPYPPAERVVEPALVRRLLEEQHPRFLGPEPILVAEGWDNTTFRVGHHAVRLPRRLEAVALLENEQFWLPRIAGRIPVSVPTPVAVGLPSVPFDWPWSVVEWIEGGTADVAGLQEANAEALARVLRSLHEAASPEAPRNPYRSIPLVARQELVIDRIERLGLQELYPIWRAAVREAVGDSPCWIHGDLHGRNVIVHQGRLMGIIDWGDLCAGDVATDLACAWMLFHSESARRRLLGAYGAPAGVSLRARGWAVNLATGMVDSGVPAYVAMGERTISNLMSDHS